MDFFYIENLNGFKPKVNFFIQKNVSSSGLIPITGTLNANANQGVIKALLLVVLYDCDTSVVLTPRHYDPLQLCFT